MRPAPLADLAPATTRYVSYMRIGDEDRGQPLLTLAAQERMIRAFMDEHAGTDARLIAEICDRHPWDGGTSARLQQAQSMCREHSARLLVARLDRLPVGVAGDADIFPRLRVATLPDATQAELTLHARLLAQERAALARLPVERTDPAKARPEQEAKVPDQVARIVMPMRQRGASLRDIADVLNRTGLVTARGTAWRPVQVSRVLQQMQ